MTQPTIHIKIKKDSPAAKVFLEYLEEKRMFREACEAGRGIEYLESKKVNHESDIHNKDYKKS